jgi:hypothetical protein
VEREFAGKQRDIICMLGLSNWSDDARFAANGLPLWDRYVVYYATDDAESGKLMRAELAPDFPTGQDCLRIAPFNLGLLGAVGQPIPPDELALIGRQQVVDHLEEFSCDRDDAYQVVRVSLSGRRVSGAKADGIARTDEEFEAVFEFDPLNTSPRL